MTKSYDHCAVKLVLFKQGLVICDTVYARAVERLLGISPFGRNPCRGNNRFPSHSKTVLEILS